MKFISKNANLRVVLRPGMPAELMTGRAATPGLYAKFEDGVLESNDIDFCKVLMTVEKGFGSDFILADNTLPDPFLRTSSEPEHTLMEIKYGHVEKSINPRPSVVISPEMKKAIEKMAIDMAKEMAPKMAIELLQTLKEQSTAQHPQLTVAASGPKVQYEGKEEGSEGKEEAETKKEVKSSPWCSHCDSKGVRHKKECTRPLPPLVDEDGPVPHVEV